MSTELPQPMQVAFMIDDIIEAHREYDREPTKVNLRKVANAGQRLVNDCRWNVVEPAKERSEDHTSAP